MSKFKVIDKKDDVEWEAEEITTHSKTTILDDKGDGQPVILKFFDFAADPVTFKQHKPTAQELFNSHIKGIEVLLWQEGLKPFSEVEPRLMFSKNKMNYRFIIACVPSLGHLFTGQTKTLAQLLQ